MAFSVRAITANVGVATLASTAQTLPTHAAGDILICLCTQHNVGSASTFGFSGSGWAEHRDSPFSNANIQSHLIWKLAANASETQPSVSWTGSGANDGRIHALASITGGSTSTYPFGPSSAVSNNASNQNIALANSVSVAANWAAMAVGVKLFEQTTRSFAGANFTINTNNICNSTYSSLDHIGVVSYMGENTAAATTTGTAGLFTITGGSAAISIGFYITIKKLNAIEDSSKRALRDFNQHFLRI